MSTTAHRRYPRYQSLQRTSHNSENGAGTPIRKHTKNTSSGHVPMRNVWQLTPPSLEKLKRERTHLRGSSAYAGMQLTLSPSRASSLRRKNAKRETLYQRIIRRLRLLFGRNRRIRQAHLTRDFLRRKPSFLVMPDRSKINFRFRRTQALHKRPRPESWATANAIPTSLGVDQQPGGSAEAVLISEKARKREKLSLPSQSGSSSKYSLERGLAISHEASSFPSTPETHPPKAPSLPSEGLPSGSAPYLHEMGYVPRLEQPKQQETSDVELSEALDFVNVWSVYLKRAIAVRALLRKEIKTLELQDEYMWAQQPPGPRQEPVTPEHSLNSSRSSLPVTRPRLSPTHSVASVFSGRSSVVLDLGLTIPKPEGPRSASFESLNKRYSFLLGPEGSNPRPSGTFSPEPSSQMQTPSLVPPTSSVWFTSHKRGSSGTTYYSPANTAFSSSPVLATVEQMTDPEKAASRARGPDFGRPVSEGAWMHRGLSPGLEGLEGLESAWRETPESASA